MEMDINGQQFPRRPPRSKHHQPDTFSHKIVTGSIFLSYHDHEGWSLKTYMCFPSSMVIEFVLEPPKEQFRLALFFRWFGLPGGMVRIGF